MVYVPVVIAGTVTLTLIVQVLLAAMVPFEKESAAAPATGANVGVPQPVVDALVGLAIVMAPGVVGKVSVKLSPLTLAALGFVNVKVRVEMPPALVGSGLKFFAMVRVDGSRTNA